MSGIVESVDKIFFEVNATQRQTHSGGLVVTPGPGPAFTCERGGPGAAREGIPGKYIDDD